MNESNREVEYKYLVSNVQNMEVLTARLNNILRFNEIEVARTVVCETNDYYFRLPKSASQFIRLRDSWGVGDDGHSRQLKEITSKAKDKGHNNDRLEINLEIKDSKQAMVLLEHLAGESVGSIYKKEFIVFTKDGAIISTAEIGGQYYLEVEGKNTHHVLSYSSFLNDQLSLKTEHRSFFEIYILKQKEVA